MKLKVWLEILLLIIDLTIGTFMFYDLELSIVPFLISCPIFIVLTCILSEYGTLQHKLIGKLEHFICK